MNAALAIAGWAGAVLLAVRVRALAARLARVADAEHELRGPLTAFALAVEAARRTPAGRRIAISLDSELARARAGLDDLTAARAGHERTGATERVALERLVRSSALAWGRRRRVRVDWRAGAAVVRADRGALAQALGNVLANATEHGQGPIAVRADRTSAGVRLDVVNGRSGDRGRGLRVARRAASRAGGSLDFAAGSRTARARLVLPVEP